MAASVNDSVGVGGVVSAHDVNDAYAITATKEESTGRDSASSNENEKGLVLPQPSMTGASVEGGDGELSHSSSLRRGASNSQPSTTFKFHYEPLEFERNYYHQLFDLAKANSSSVDDDTIIPPKDAAKLFVTSGIPPDRLRVIWNMSVLPATPYPPGTKPPPAMNAGQFQVAVRLIQLYQNRITAKDEWLRVPKEVQMAPAYFDGVSGVLVPMPWKGDDGVVMNGDDLNSATNNSKENVSRSKDSYLLNSPPENIYSTSASMRSKNEPAAKENTGSRSMIGRILQPRRRSTDPSRPVGEESMRQATRRSTLPSESSLNMGCVRRPSFLTCDSPEISWPNDDYFMSQNDCELYRDVFLMHCVTEADVQSQPQQRMNINTAVRLFDDSGLSRDILRKIWDVVVTDSDLGFLNEIEFVLISHLISCVTDGGHAVPTVLPPPLSVWKMARLAGQEKRKKKEAPQIWNESLSEFVPIVSSASTIADDEARITDGSRNIGDQQSSIDRQRLNQMEQEILLLNQSVLSLKLDVQDLKHALREIKSVRRQSSATNGSDDVPNVDVEMYWNNKKDETPPKSGMSTTSSSKTQATPPATANPPMPSRRGISQNIPSVHTGYPTTENRSRSLHQSKMHNAMPQSRGNDAIKTTMLARDEHTRIGDDGSTASSINPYRIHQQLSNSDTGSTAASRVAHKMKVTTFHSELRSHIARSRSGEPEAFKTMKPASTAAVDLPPL
ncbi:hypothetical protein ACHAWU_009288 [Discostella pseudostelligera]|uniref:EH domain-containing protein n=1 Tax=Discostella pseudostelligera TaxID=259834 RepID=A0ABD3M5W5_9STRA